MSTMEHATATSPAAVRPRGLQLHTVIEAFSSTAMFATLIAIIGLPIVFIGISSVAQDPFDISAGFTLDTLVSVYTSPRILTSLWQTIAMSIVVGVLSTAIGGILAWVITRFRLPAAGLLEMLVVLPLFMSPLIGVIAWVSLAAPNSGIINELLDMIGMPEFLRFNIMTVEGIIFVKVAHYVPYGYLFLAGTLRNTDASLEEAAYIAGSNVPRTAFNILLPLLRSSSLSAVMFISILAAGEFSVSAILGIRTDFVPLSVHVYEAVYGYPQNYARATAIGTQLMLISVVAFYLYRRSMRDSQRFVTVTGRGFAIRAIDPGKWKQPILWVFGIYAFITVVVPNVGLVFMAFARFRTGSVANTEFTFDNILGVLATPNVPLATMNSLIISGLVPVICVIFALILVFANDRLKMRGSEVATYIASVPIAISGIVFGTGIFIIYIHSPLYGTIWLIVLGLVASYLTHAIRIASNGVTQIDRALEEAASINGAPRGTVLRTIVAPLLRPSLLSALILIFVFSIREVNTTILLYSPNSLTLSVQSWNYANDGYLASASVVGLIQTILMVAVIGFARLFLGVQSIKNSL